MPVGRVARCDDQGAGAAQDLWHERMRPFECDAGRSRLSGLGGADEDGYLQHCGAVAVGVGEVFLDRGTGDGQAVAVKPVEEVLPGLPDPGRGWDDDAYHGAGRQREPLTGPAGVDGGGEAGLGAGT